MLSSSMRDEVAELLASGRKILAVKLVREELGCSLLEAKSLVEELETEPEMQLRIASSRASGTATATATGRPWLFALVFLFGFGGAGVAMLCIAAVTYTRQQGLIARGVRCEAKVIELARRNDAFAPVFEYELDGVVRTYQSSVASRPASVAVGDTVWLWVDPADPGNVVADTFVDRYLMLVILGPMGVLFTMIGLVPLGACLLKGERRDEARGQFVDPMQQTH